MTKIRGKNGYIPEHTMEVVNLIKNTEAIHTQAEALKIMADMAREQIRQDWRGRKRPET